LGIDSPRLFIPIVGREEELEVVGWENSDEGQEDSEEEEDDMEEGHEEDVRLVNERVGVMGLLQDLDPHTDLGHATLFTFL
jgi:NACalpha-BTF3-like transcription factor